jgi:hypothetical protein
MAMNPIRILQLAACATLATAAAAQAQRHVGQLCGDPARVCEPGFRPNELPFVLPRDSVAREELRSDTFYAVILRSAPRCSIPERERVAAQALFPGRKVFSQRFECGVDQATDDAENAITYTNVAENTAFLAIYAGAAREQALRVLAAARRRFPGANLRRMQVVLVYP